MHRHRIMNIMHGYKAMVLQLLFREPYLFTYLRGMPSDSSILPLDFHYQSIFFNKGAFIKPRSFLINDPASLVNFAL